MSLRKIAFMVSMVVVPMLVSCTNKKEVNPTSQAKSFVVGDDTLVFSLSFLPPAGSEKLCFFRKEIVGDQKEVGFELDQSITFLHEYALTRKSVVNALKMQNLKTQFVDVGLFAGTLATLATAPLTMGLSLLAFPLLIDPDSQRNGELRSGTKNILVKVNSGKDVLEENAETISTDEFSALKKVLANAEKKSDIRCEGILQNAAASNSP